MMFYINLLLEIHQQIHLQMEIDVRLIQYLKKNSIFLFLLVLQQILLSNNDGTSNKISVQNRQPSLQQQPTSTIMVN